MNKKRAIALVLITIMIVCAGCFGDPVKSDLEEYLKFAVSIEKEAQDLSLEMAGNMSNAVKSKEQMVAMMKDVNQKLLTFSEKEKNYKPKTKEVQDIHAKGILVYDSTVDMFKQLITLVEAGNPTKEQENNLRQKQQRIVELTKEYQDAVNKLATEKKVEVKLKF